MTENDTIMNSFAPATPVAVLKVDADTELSLSFSGRFAAFSTSAALVPEDSNGLADIYVRDFTTGVTLRVSAGAGGAQANGASSQPSLSADGRHLVFTSLASNLVAGDSNGVSDVFHVDMQTGAVKLVSGAGFPANGASHSGDISANGRVASFVSAATNLTPLTADTGSHIYHKELDSGLVKLVSAKPDGQAGTGISFAPDVSADGNIIAFSSFSGNLSATPTAGLTPLLYMKGMASGAVFDGWAVNGLVPDLLPIQAPMISADAQQATVTIRNIVYFLDFEQKVAADISSGARGEYTGFAANRAMSLDGQRVLYAAAGDDTLGGDDNPFIQLYLRNTADDTLMRISTGSEGFAANADIGHATLSGDGKVIMFVSTASNLGGPNPGQAQLFRMEVATMEAVTTNGYLSDSAVTASLAAGPGHDTYFISHATTAVLEAPNGGHDRVVSNLDGYTLPANVENLVLGLALTGSGNELSNQIRGNAADNVLMGGAGDDWLNGLAGSDSLDGGAGLDTAVYHLTSSELAIGKSATGFKVSSPAFPGDVDSLIGIERIKLSDVMVGLDIDGVGGQAYRIYKAAFDRVPDLAGLGYWIDVMDQGADLKSVAAGFIGSPEFLALYGSAPDNLSLVTRMYGNVLDRVPDQAGLDYWVDLLDRDIISRADALRGFSESAENYAAVIGQIENGFYFTGMA